MGAFSFFASPVFVEPSNENPAKGDAAFGVEFSVAAGAGGVRSEAPNAKGDFSAAAEVGASFFSPPTDKGLLALSILRTRECAEFPPLAFAFVSGTGSPAFLLPSYVLPLSSAAAFSRSRSIASSFSRAILCFSTIALASAIWAAQSSVGAEAAAANGFAPAGAAPSFDARPK